MVGLYSFLLLVILIICYILYILPKKRIITIDSSGIAILILSLIVKTNISDINKNSYKSIFDDYIIKINSLNFNQRIFTKMKYFEEYFWSNLTQSNCFEYYKNILYIIDLIGNNKIKRLLYYILNNIFKLLLTFYKVYNDSINKEDFLSKVILLETIIKAYQISSIMNTDIKTVIKKMRLIRNLKIYDKNTKNIYITRQVRYPMVGSEVCPFINHIKKINKPDANLKYSILIFEKKYNLEMKQYLCNIHDSCILYKDKKGIIKHLEECEFWNDNDYWEKMYPLEKEII